MLIGRVLVEGDGDLSTAYNLAKQIQVAPHRCRAFVQSQEEERNLPMLKPDGSKNIGARSVQQLDRFSQMNLVWFQDWTALRTLFV